jgi:ArsR family transcriptional regulator
MEEVHVFKVLADATRWRILDYLEDPVQVCDRHDAGICSCDIEMTLGLAQGTVSHHMQQLTDAGLVRAERRGRYVYYELDRDRFQELGARLGSLGDREAGA